MGVGTAKEAGEGVEEKIIVGKNSGGSAAGDMEREGSKSRVLGKGLKVDEWSGEHSRGWRGVHVVRRKKKGGESIGRGSRIGAKEEVRLSRTVSLELSRHNIWKI